MHGYADSMVDAVTGPLVGHVQVHAPEWRDEHAMDLVLEDVDAQLAAIRGVPGVKSAAPRIYGPALGALGEEGHVVMVIGVDPAIEGGEGGMLAGVPRAELPAGTRVLVGSALAQTMGVHAGDEIAIVGQAIDGSIANDLYRVGGVFTSQIGDVQQHGVVMALAAAQELFAMPGEAHEITVRGASAEDAEALAGRIAALPAIAGDEVRSWRQLVPELVTLVSLIDSSSWIVVLLVFIAATAGIANMMLMATFERSHEIGMLLALGSAPGRIVRMVVTEGAALGLLGVAIGTVLGIVVVAVSAHSGIDLTTFGNEAARELSFQGLNYQFEIVPRVETMDVIQGVCGVLLTSFLASLWPAAHAARLQPTEAMRS
jgi:putative ABC transport system permease protein